jgi:hypothetical protein
LLLSQRLSIRAYLCLKPVLFCISYKLGMHLDATLGSNLQRQVLDWRKSIQMKNRIKF